MEKTFHITLVYKVSVHEEDLLKYRSSPDREELERAKRLLDATLKDQDTANYLMLRAAAFDLADLAESYGGLCEVFTGHEVDDHAPAEKVIEKLPSEDREYFSQYVGGVVVETLEDVFKAELDHLHIGVVEDEQHTSQAQPQKQRHHKRKRR